MVGGHYNRVSDQVINIIYPHRTWKTSVADLQRGSSRRKDVRSAVVGKTITIDSYVNFHISCKFRDINVCVRIYIYKFVESRFEPRLEFIRTFRRKRKTDNLKFRVIMPFKHLDHRVGACMIAKIRRKITNAYFIVSLTFGDFGKHTFKWIDRESVDLGSFPLQLRRITCREQCKWMR